MLSVVVADSLEVLAARLGGVLGEPPSDPLAGDWVAVPPGGIERWLSLRLARDLGASSPGAGDGVSANITFARPGALRRAVLDAGRHSDPTRQSAPDPWTVDRMTWAVLVARDALGPILPSLPAHRSITTWAQRVAGRFDRYHVYRPDMIRAWAVGHDLGGAGQRLPGADRWQAELWRALRALIDEPSPPELLPGLFEVLRSGELPLALPDRLALFGFAALPGGASFGDLVSAVATTRDVNLFILDPCPQLTWAAIAGARGGLEGTPVRVDDEPVAMPDIVHPLVRSWGRLTRETASLLPRSGDVDGNAPGIQRDLVDTVEPASSPGLLGTLQRAIATGSAETVLGVVAEHDRSIQVHGCQGATRQVEVLRDAVLHLLAADPSLREDDVVVICPDLERFGPLVHAVLGASVEGGSGPVGDGPDARAPGLRYRVLDPAGAPVNPVVDAFSAMLDLVSGRFTASDVVAFCELEPVRRRWGFTDDDLAAIDRWVSDLHIRWGLDPANRRRFGVPERIEAGTWQRALDRLLLGVALPHEDALVLDGALPFGVEGSEVSVLGRLTDLVGRLAHLATGADEPRRASDRLDELRRAFDQLLAPDPEAGWQAEAVTRALSRLDDDDRQLPGWVDDLDLDFVELGSLVRERLAFAGRRSGYFTGGVTFTSLGALRGVPFRVVCLLGLDESALPAASIDGDDLTSTVPFAGDPDRAAEARRSLLAAVAMAGDHLLVLHDDRDVASNAPLPPSVVLHELLEAVEGLLAPGASDDLRSRVVTHHPRQATDRGNFVPDPLGGPNPWSFDPSALAGARARATASEGRATLSDAVASVGPTSTAPVELADLRDVLGDPAKFFCNRVLDVHLPRDEGELVGALPVSLDALERWDVRTRLLRDLGADDVDPELVAGLERARDTLPVGVLGEAALAAALGLVDPVLAAQRRLLGDASSELVRLAIGLPDGREVRGELPIWTTDEVAGTVDVSMSRHKPKDDLRAWVDLLLLTASRPERHWRGVLLRAHDKGDVGTTIGLTVDPDEVGGVLAQLVAFHDAVRSGPVPFFPALSEQIADGKGPVDLGREWDELFQTDAAVRFLFGDWTIARLFAEPSLATDLGVGAGRAERLAEAIWGLFDATTATEHFTASNPGAP